MQRIVSPYYPQYDRYQHSPVFSSLEAQRAELSDILYHLAKAEDAKNQPAVRFLQETYIHAYQGFYRRNHLNELNYIEELVATIGPGCNLACEGCQGPGREHGA